MKTEHESLVREAKLARAQEKEGTKRVLFALQKIERERIHIEIGYESLHAFCERELDYSSGEAHRRVQAMRLLKALPEVEAALDQGEMTLTTMAGGQNFVKHDGTSQ